MYGSIAPDQTILGNFWSETFFFTTSRDTDNFIFEVEAPGDCFRATLLSDVTALVFLVSGIPIDGSPCSSAVIEVVGFNNGYPAELCFSEPGAYAVEVLPSIFPIFECPGDSYTVLLEKFVPDAVTTTTEEPGIVPEGERCGNLLNEGCNSNPPAYGSIAVGETVGGNIWADAAVGDTDWYLFEVPNANDCFSATLFSDTKLLVSFVSGITTDGSTCSDTAFGIGLIGDNSGTPAQVCFPEAGFGIVFVTKEFNEDLPCPGDSYTVSLETLGAVGAGVFAGVEAGASPIFLGHGSSGSKISLNGQ